jgi:hypothetical protein
VVTAESRRKFEQRDPFYAEKVRDSSLVEMRQMISVVHGGEDDD